MPKTEPDIHRLKIGLVLDDSLDKSDGVQQYVIAVGEWLHSQGHDVHYLVGQTERRDLPNIHSLSRNLMVRFNGNRMSMPLPTSRAKLRDLLQREQFDVLHIQTPFSPWLAGRIIRLASPQTLVIGTFHILPNSRLSAFGSRLLAIWTRPALRRFDSMLSVSTAAQAFAKKCFGIDSTVLPNVFDYSRFADARALSDDKRLTILFLGRLVPRKGCRYLLEAVARLDRTLLPEFRVLICGKGPLLGELKAYVSEKKLESIVEFTGFVHEADKPGYYASADIAVFPSTGGESFGIVLIEAMANGRTSVLAGDNPGYASVMTPQPELLFEPGNPAALAKLLKKHLTDPAVRRSAGAWGRQYSRQFDVNIVGQRLVSLYEQLHRTKNVR